MNKRIFSYGRLSPSGKMHAEWDLLYTACGLDYQDWPMFFLPQEITCKRCLRSITKKQAATRKNHDL